MTAMNVNNKNYITKYMFPILLLLNLAFIIQTMIIYFNYPTFSPDSWTYYELSKSLMRGGYHLDHVREFISNVDAPSKSFPPLFPALWGIADTITGLGFGTGLFLNFALLFAIALQAEYVIRRISNEKYLGLSIAAIIFILPGFFEEIVSARAIPLSICMVFILFMILSRSDKLSTFDALMAGLASGACVMIRFDMVPFCICVSIAILLTQRNVVTIAVFVTGLVITVSPWILSSLYFHNRIFASDSSWVALSADRNPYVTDWHPSGEQRASLFNAPKKWAIRIIYNAKNFATSIWRAPGAIVGSLIVTIALMYMAYVKDIKTSIMNSYTHENAKYFKRSGIIITLAALAMLPSYILTGYFDIRYFSLIIICILMWLVTIPLFHAKTKRIVNIIILVFLIITPIYGTIQNLTYLDAQRNILHSPFSNTKYMDLLMKCTEYAAPERRRVVFARGMESQAARVSALYSIPTSFLPNNLKAYAHDETAIAEFLDTFKIGFMIGIEPKDANTIFPSGWTLIEAPECGPGVHHIVRKKR